MPRLLTASDLHKQFETELKVRFPERLWTIAIFEGSPVEGLYSWCPDCIVASSHIKHFEKLRNRIKLVKFKVGTKKEWENKSARNPFKTNFPFLSDVPTAILFMRSLDVYRIVAPRQADLTSMCKRADVYERQARSGDWHPPLGKRLKE